MSDPVTVDQTIENMKEAIHEEMELLKDEMLRIISRLRVEHAAEVDTLRARLARDREKIGKVRDDMAESWRRMLLPQTMEGLKSVHAELVAQWIAAMDEVLQTEINPKEAT